MTHAKRPGALTAPRLNVEVTKKYEPRIPVTVGNRDMWARTLVVVLRRDSVNKPWHVDGVRVSAGYTPTYMGTRYYEPDLDVNPNIRKDVEEIERMVVEDAPQGVA